MRRIGILGLGEGLSVLAAAEASEHWEVGHLCDLDPELLRQRQTAYGVAAATTDYAAMLADRSLDAVMIYTPDPLHAGHILQAFEAGKHVICTKPLVDSLADGPALLRAQQASGRQLIVGQTFRFFPPFMRQRTDLLAGRHGGLVSCEAHYNGDKRLGSAGRRGKKGEVNWLYSGLGHAVDLVYWHLGPIRTVSGMAVLSEAGERLGSVVPDSFHAVLTAESGQLGLVSGVYGAAEAHDEAHPVAGCSLRGGAGSSSATYPRFDYYTRFDGEEPAKRSFPDSAGAYFPWGGAKYHAGEMRNLLDDFHGCLESGEAPCPGLADGLQVVATLQAIERSIARESHVAVADLLAESGCAGLL